MNTPRFLVAAALLFWGWQSGHWLLALPAAAAAESFRFISARWSLTQADFNRLWNICSVLFLGTATFLFINEGTVSFNDFFADAGRRPEAIKQAGRSALTWFQWFPVIFLPFLLAQSFNDTPRVGLATFSWWLRRQEARDARLAAARETIDVSYPYVALCLLSASATLDRAVSFYPGLVAVVAWASWSARARRRSAAVWLALLGVPGVAGYAGQAGLSRLQKKLEEMNVSWFTRLAATGFNDKEARTRLGAIGRLKNSDRIVFRLRTDGERPPELLREASFNAYRGALWTIARREFMGVPVEADGSTWKLLPRKAVPRVLGVAGYFRGGEGLLPLPTGAAVVGELPVGALSTNEFGAAKMEGGPGMAMFEVRYDRGATFDSGWTDDDLRLPRDTEPAVAHVAAQLGLHSGLAAPEAMRRVAKHFADHFQYASLLTAEHAPRSNETALARFLLHTRSGHCEYFATATALLLRHAGVPARYAVGYSVQEGRGRKYLIRDRHAHAWTLVWDGQNWIDFDTTPASWSAIEGAAHASWWRPVKDFFSDAWFQFSKFRWGRTEWRRWFMLAPVPLLIVVVVRFFFGRQWRALRARSAAAQAGAARPGADSEFFRVANHLAACGWPRAPGESWSAWTRRLETQDPALGGLRPLVRLHQRHRFDPAGLNAAERDELRAAVEAWLAARRAR